MAISHKQTVKDDWREDITRTHKYIYFLMFGLGVSFAIISDMHFIEKIPILFGDESGNYKKLVHGLNLLVHELGFALMVSSLLIFTVEKFTKDHHRRSTNELIKEINHDLFLAVYRRDISKKVLKEVEASLFKSEVSRTKYRVFYDLEHVPHDEDKVDKPEHLIGSLRAIYTLKNITNREIETDIISDIELPIDNHWKNTPEFTSFEIWKRNKNVIDLSNEHKGRNILTLFKKDISSYVSRNNEQVHFSYPLTMSPKEELEITIKGTVLKRSTDSEIWSSIIPSNGIEMNVSLPSDIEVFAKANHSKKLRLLYENDNKKTSRTWILDGGIFPHQAIVFWWSMKNRL